MMVLGSEDLAGSFKKMNLSMQKYYENIWKLASK